MNFDDIDLWKTKFKFFFQKIMSTTNKDKDDAPPGCGEYISQGAYGKVYQSLKDKSKVIKVITYKTE